MKRILSLTAMLCFLFLPVTALGAACTGSSPTWTATPDRASVASCVSQASDGDTINVSAGDGTETWNAGVTWANKGLKLVGPGEDNLTVTCPNNTCVQLTGTQNGSRISGLTFDHGSYSQYTIYIDGAITEWRIDNVTITRSAFAESAIFVIGALPPTTFPKGLIDNCTFIEACVLVYGEYYDTGGSSCWDDNLELGTDEAVYIEDCTFTYNTEFSASRAFDSYLGGKVVFRFNTVNDGYLEAHSIQGDNQRAVRKWEIYENTLTSVSGNPELIRPAIIKGGTGVIFNNETDDSDDPYTINNVWYFYNERSTNDRGVWDKCDGNSWVDGNEGGQSGYLCRDQIGASKDASTWDYSEPAPTQSKAPAYIWGNTDNAAQVDADIYGEESTVHIIENRDFYNEDDSFDGTSGVGVGTLASCPATCTTGVAYWATDQGSWNATGADGVLYKCTSTDTWEVYFTPYTYPHPLRTEELSYISGCTLSAGEIH